MMTIENQKVTIGLKVTKEEKLLIRATSEQHNMNVSEYLNALVFSKNERLNLRLHLPDELVIAPNYQDVILSKIQTIQQQFPNRTATEIIHVALHIAMENEKLVTNNKFKKYL